MNVARINTTTDKDHFVTPGPLNLKALDAIKATTRIAQPIFRARIDCASFLTQLQLGNCSDRINFLANRLRCIRMTDDGCKKLVDHYKRLHPSSSPTANCASEVTEGIELELSSCPITDRALEVIQDIAYLKKLILTHCPEITQEGIRAFKEKCPKVVLIQTPEKTSIRS